MNKIIEVEHFTKRYGDFTAVDDISFTVDEGSIFAFLGPNGAGKTTMIKMMADVLRPDSGQILYDGQDIHIVGDKYRAKVGYLPQEISFYSNFTGRDYLEYSAALKGMEKSYAKKRIEELAYNVGLQNDLKRQCHTYSGGMQRRLGIAQALLDNPEILILDEPTAGLDPLERIKFRNIISAYSNNRLVLLSTHIVSDVEHIASKIMMMEYGVIRYINTRDEYIKMAENCVWLVKMSAEKLVNYQNNAVISNVIAKDGVMEIRVIDEEKPFADAVQAAPTLEDVYLYIFNYLPARARR